MLKISGRNLTILSLNYLKPLAFISVIVGLSPFSAVRVLTAPSMLIEAEDFLRPVGAPRTSNWSLLYILVTGLAMNTWNVIVLYETFILRKRLDGYPTYQNLVFVVCFFLVAPATVLYVKAFRRKHVETECFRSRLGNVDRKIYSIKTRIIDRNNGYKSLIMKLVATVIANTAVYSVDIYAADPDDLIFVVNRGVSHLVSTIALLEFCLLLDVVKNRFKVVNEIVQEFVSPGTYQVSPRELKTLSALEEVVIPRRLRKKKLTYIWDRRQKLSTLKILRQVHSDLCSLSRDVDAAFRSHLLLDVALVFFILILCGHFLLNNDPEVFSSTQTIFKANMFIWFIYSTMRLLLVIGQCGSVTTEAVRTSELLMSTPMEDQEDDNTDTKFGLQVLLFSQQLARTSSVVRFRAGGVFMLDMQLMVAMLGTITSYLVVLQQIK